MARAINLGMPRIGPRRQLKRAVEGYWAGALDAGQLAEVARTRRAEGWTEQVAAGIGSLPSNDFSLYDQVLDTTCLVGAVPDRFRGGGPRSTSTPTSPWPGAPPGPPDRGRRWWPRSR